MRLLGASRHPSQSMPGSMPDGSGCLPAPRPGYAGPHAGPLGTLAGMGASRCWAACRSAQDPDRHGSQSMSGCMPVRSGAQAACQPAHAGPHAGLCPGSPGSLPLPGISASLCRLMCRISRGTGRHGSQFMPAVVPALHVCPTTYLPNGYFLLRSI